jgi:hypothetical protein
MDEAALKERFAALMPYFEVVYRKQNRVTLTAAALQGLIVRADYQSVHPETLAAHAIALADATLAKLERGE